MMKLWVERMGNDKMLEASRLRTKNLKVKMFGSQGANEFITEKNVLFYRTIALSDYALLIGAKSAALKSMSDGTVFKEPPATLVVVDMFDFDDETKAWGLGAVVASPILKLRVLDCQRPAGSEHLPRRS